MAKSLGELAQAVGGRVVGNSALAISGVSNLQAASAGELSFVADEKRWVDARRSAASAFVVKVRPADVDKPCIEVDQPFLAFAKITAMLDASSRVTEPFRVHPTALVDPGAKVEERVAIGPYAVVEAGVVIESGARVGAHCVVGPDVRLGGDVRLFPNVTIIGKASLGSRVVVHSGTVIGSDGFGYARQPDGSHFKMPQLGSIRIEDDVEIGSNVSIDRATFGETVIGRGTKIDNLVQVAHNVVIGRDVILAGQVGLSGSIIIGDRSILAGQVGVADHVSIGKDVVILGRSGVLEDVSDGQVMFGYPARPHRETAKQLAEVAMLTKMRSRVRDLEKRLAALEGAP